MQGRTYDRPADQRTVGTVTVFSRVEWAAIRVAAARAGVAVRIWIHNVAATAALNSQLTETPPMQPDTKTPSGEAAAKATMLRVTNPSDGLPDATRADELAKRQPCAGRPEPFVPPKSATNEP